MSAPNPRRRRIRRLPRATRMQTLMDAARAVFCERGYADAPTAEIAARAGVVEGSIYRFFKTKRDLLIKVVEDWYAHIFADYDQQLKRITGTRNRLRYMIWRHLAVIHGDPAMCRLIFSELRSGPEYRETSVFALNRAYTRRTLNIIEEGIEKGELRADVPLNIARDMIYGAVEHHTFAFLRSEGAFNPDAAADAITDLIYRGMADPKSRSAAAQGDPLHRLENVTQRLEHLAASARKPSRK